MPLRMSNQIPVREHKSLLKYETISRYPSVSSFLFSFFRTLKQLFSTMISYGKYIPISFALTEFGLLSSVTNFLASSRTSMTLLSRAKTGARGKEATKRVTKPNCMTGREKSIALEVLVQEKSKSATTFKTMVRTYVWMCVTKTWPTYICLRQRNGFPLVRVSYQQLQPWSTGLHCLMHTLKSCVNACFLLLVSKWDS